MRRRLRYVRRYQGTSSELNHGQSRTGDVFLLLRGAFDCAVATVAATAVTAGSPAAGVAGEARLRAPAGARPLRRELDQAARLLMIAPVFLAPAALCTVAETFGTRLIALPVTCAVQQLDARGAQALASIDRVIRQLELGPGPLPSRSAPSVELMELFGALVRPPSPSPYHALSNTMGKRSEAGAKCVCVTDCLCLRRPAEWIHWEHHVSSFQSRQIRWFRMWLHSPHRSRNQPQLHGQQRTRGPHRLAPLAWLSFPHSNRLQRMPLPQVPLPLPFCSDLPYLGSLFR